MEQEIQLRLSRNGVHWLMQWRTETPISSVKHGIISRLIAKSPHSRCSPHTGEIEGLPYSILQEITKELLCL